MFAVFARDSVCRIDDGDVTGCSMGQIEAALGVEAVGAALARVEDEASVADREASEVPVGGFHARHASHDLKDFDRRVGGGEKGGVVVKPAMWRQDCMWASRPTAVSTKR